MQKLFVVFSWILLLLARPCLAERLYVVTTTGMLADVARAVGGDRVSVDQVMGPGVDPHLYKLTRADVGKLSRAHIVIHNGLKLEGKALEVIDRLKASGKRVIDYAEGINPENVFEHSNVRGSVDPHVWMDPIVWSAGIERLVTSFIEADGASSEYFRGNGKRYVDALRKLHDANVETLSSVVDKQRVLVTAHDAFEYFGRRYNFQVLGIQGISTESEAGLRDIENIIDVIVARRVPAVFVESTVSKKNIEALIQGSAARGWNVTIGGELYSDAMGHPGSNAETYIGMIQHNVRTIADALKGVASTSEEK